MKFHAATAYILTASSACAFMTPITTTSLQRQQAQYTASRPSILARNVVSSPPDETTTITSDTKRRPIYDPLGLYPESSEEYQEGRIQPLEPTSSLERIQDQQQLVVDSMGLYPKNSPEYMESFELEQEYSRSRRPIYDPMGLYPQDSVERQEGKIHAMEPKEQIVKDVKDPLGLYPKDSAEFERSIAFEKEGIDAQNHRKIYDPLGLYPASSQERQEGRIEADETIAETVVKPVLDPMNLYKTEQRASGEVEDQGSVVMSEALPFMARPAVLNGELAGDAGFDPLGFSKTKSDLAFMRQAELKHARIAMLAAVGWPISELFDKKLAALVHMKPLLVEGDRVPSLLNGGLSHVNPFYWMGVLALAGLAEGIQMMNAKDGWAVTVNDKGGPGFDPLNLFPKDAAGQKRMELAEIKNGRVAMLAVVAFAVMEALTKTAVVDSTPFLFHPPF